MRIYFLMFAAGWVLGKLDAKYGYTLGELFGSTVREQIMEQK